jgi:hypothetical protein
MGPVGTTLLGPLVETIDLGDGWGLAWRLAPRGCWAEIVEM